MKQLFKKACGIALLATTSLVPQKAFACSEEPYLAGLCVFAGTFAPRGYMVANGQLISISQNQALFSLLGTNFGGDGRTSFGVPEMTGRVAIGMGQGAGLENYRIGQKGGANTVALTVLNLPQHNHIATTTISASLDDNALNENSSITLKGHNATASTVSAQGASLAKINARRAKSYSTSVPNVSLSSNSVDVAVDVANTTATVTNNVLVAGASQAHENRTPYIKMYWVIATTGIFPSRS